MATIGQTKHVPGCVAEVKVSRLYYLISYVAHTFRSSVGTNPQVETPESSDRAAREPPTYT